VEEPVIVTNYDPRWPRLFDQLREEMEQGLGDVAVVIEHVGSTAVPGLAAKPTIDLDIVVRSSDDVPAAIRLLESLGYRHEGDLGVPGKEAYLPPRPLPQHHHHLYVVVLGSKPYRDHLDFRDFLRAHPEEAHRYGELKRTLAELVGQDRNAYTKAKSALVEEMLASARGS
jgi:GrpB-like predicted nucleotidyltransferase (UPF0157 family)